MKRRGGAGVCRELLAWQTKGRAMMIVRPLLQDSPLAVGGPWSELSLLEVFCHNRTQFLDLAFRDKVPLGDQGRGKRFPTLAGAVFR
jgi:hypothetical protein